MEGIAGIVHTDQTRRAGSDYALARRWMTAEANAAIVGAFEGGADAVLVNDAHGTMRNLLLDELDPRAEVLSGALKPASMVEGLEGRFDLALFVGYHAGAGTRAGILDHTYDSRVVIRCRVGNREFDETAINALVCGEQGTPVGLVTGDQAVCGSAKALLGDVITVQVKDAITRFAARSISVEHARAKVREGARAAVQARKAGRFAPFVLPPPHALELEVANAACADAAALVPGTRRISGRVIAYDAPDAATLLRVLLAWTILGASTIT
jgi:D-amino peptidase